MCLCMCVYACVRVRTQACMGVCGVMANDYLYTSVFGLELCVFGHSLTMSQRLEQPRGTFSLR